MFKFVERILLKLPPYRYYVWKVEERKIKRYAKQVESDIINAAKLLKRLNANMKAAGWPRQKIKQFWRDFQKNDMFRDDVFNDLVKERKETNDKGCFRRAREGSPHSKRF